MSETIKTINVGDIEIIGNVNGKPANLVADESLVVKVSGIITISL